MNRSNRFFGPKSFYTGALMIAVPVMLQSLIQTLISLIDSFMVSGLGDIKMSGVNIAGQLLFVFMVLMNAVCAAGGIFMTQYYGAKDKNGMQQALAFKIIVTGVSFIAYIMVALIIPRQVLGLLVRGNSQAEPILDQAVTYIRLMAIVGVPITFSTIIASSLREIGEVRVPLVIAIVATAVNTLLNYILIYGHFGAPRLEVRGAAIATIIARTIEMCVYIVYLWRRRPPFLLTFSTFRNLDLGLFRRTLAKGGMLISSDMIWVISETVTTALYNGRGGADVVSGMSASFSIANLFFVAFGGVYTATGVILGRLLGEGRLDEARRQKTWLLIASLLFGLFMVLVGFATTLLVPVVFGNLSASAQGICRNMVFYLSLFMPLWVVNNTQFAVSRAGGDTLMGMIVDGGGTLITIPVVFLLALCTSVGPVTMYILVKCVDIVKAFVAHIWLKNERWLVNLTAKQ